MEGRKSNLMWPSSDCIQIKKDWYLFVGNPLYHDDYDVMFLHDHPYEKIMFHTENGRLRCSGCQEPFPLDAIKLRYSPGSLENLEVYKEGNRWKKSQSVLSKSA